MRFPAKLKSNEKIPPFPNRLCRPINDNIPGVWTHVVGVRGANALTLYVNGSLAGSVSTTQAPNYSRGFVPEIGGNPGNSSDNYAGLIDDLRVYIRALSATEVQQLYQYESAAAPCSPHAATATAQVVNGFVVGATIADPGCGYTNAPIVQISGGGGSGAAATTVVSNGVVTGIVIMNAGAGYTGNPYIQIASPPFAPSLSVVVSAVKVTQHVVLGRNYVLESSTDLRNWTQVGATFSPQSEYITDEFQIDVTGRYFRNREVPQP